MKTQRRGFLASVLIAPFAMVGLAKPKKLVDVTECQVAFTADTTELKAALETVKELEARVNSIINIEGELIRETDLDNRILQTIQTAQRRGILPISWQ